MANAENPNHVGLRIVTVERQVPGCAVGDHQLAAMRIHPAADLRMRGEHRHGGPDLGERGAGGFRGSREKKLDDPIEVRERLARIDYPRQRTGSGRRARRPATFASR